MPRRTKPPAKPLDEYDPYGHSSDPVVNEWREHLREAHRLANQQFDYHMSRARRGEVSYVEAAKDALRRYDDTIAECKRRYLWPRAHAVQPITT